MTFRREPRTSSTFARRRLVGRVGGVATAAVCLASLTGCTPVTVAVMGLGVDADGAPVAYIKLCADDHIDMLRVYEDAPYDEPDRRGEWIANDPVTDFERVPLAQVDGWAIVTPLSVMEPAKAYTLAGWASGDQQRGSLRVAFTGAVLAELEEGEVRYVGGWDEDSEGAAVERYVVASEEVFAEEGCKALDE